MQGKFCRLLVAGTLLAMSPAQAQDIMMAPGNTQFTVSFSPLNYQAIAMKNGMERQASDLEDLISFDYSIRFSKPVSITAEYALTAYTTVGLNTNYYSYNLSETRVDAMGVTDVRTKGSHLDLHARIVRYLSTSPTFSLYLLGEIGISKRFINYSVDDANAHINEYPETRKEGFKTFSYDYGLGMRFRLFRNVGIAAECTMLSLVGRYGLFYILEPAGRRSKDQIGW